VTRDFELTATTKDNLARAKRLRSLATETTTPNLRVRLLAVAKECEWLARREPEPRVDPTLLKVRRERPRLDKGSDRHGWIVDGHHRKSV